LSRTMQERQPNVTYTVDQLGREHVAQLSRDLTDLGSSWSSLLPRILLKEGTDCADYRFSIAQRQTLDHRVSFRNHIKRPSLCLIIL
jgi:hypothetical protein